MTDFEKREFYSYKINKTPHKVVVRETKIGKCYFITFINDFLAYTYAYLMKN